MKVQFKHQAVRDEITKVVQDYIRLFPDDYKETQKVIKWKRDNLKNKFAEMKGHDIFVRKILELPVYLYNALTLKLTEPAKKYLESKGGQEWFARTFSEFSAVEKENV